MDHFNFQKASTASSIDSTQSFHRLNYIRKVNRNLQKKYCFHSLNSSQNDFCQASSTESYANSFQNLIFYSIKKIFHYFGEVTSTLNKSESQLLNKKCFGNTLTPLTLQILTFNWFTLFAILQCCFVVSISATDEGVELPICTRYQACFAEVSQFPLLSETVGNIVVEEPKEEFIEIESSGYSEGSGYNNGRAVELPTEEAHFPLYDEFVSEPTLFDFNADAELTSTQICQCPQNENEDDSINKNGCSFEHINSKHILNVDRKLRLAFCQPVTQLFKTKCAGRRGLLRVIGQVDIKLRETISSVNDTLVFCRCDPPMELKLIAIEPWLDKHAFVYRCLRS